MPDDRDLVVFGRFETEHDAHLLRLWLNDHGIPAVVAGNNQSFGPDSGLQPVHLYIRRIDLEVAGEARARWLNASPQSAIGEWVCPCGETVDAGFYTCWSCGIEYEDLLDGGVDWEGGEW